MLFFAFTGTIQTLSLHESAGSSYKPPAILAELGQLHKKQTMAMPVRKVEAAESGSHDAGRADRAKAAGQPAVTLGRKRRQHLPMKIFFVLVSVGLLSSTMTGIYMAYRYERNKLLVSGALAAGVLLPLVLIKLQGA